MNDATLAQGTKVLDLILQKRTSVSELQKFINSGILADLLEANPDQIDRVELRQLLNLPVPFYYGIEGIAIDGERTNATDLVALFGLGGNDYDSQRMVPVTFRNKDTVVRPVWVAESGTATNVLSPERFGWEEADIFDAIFFFKATKNDARFRNVTLVATGTRSECEHIRDERAFAINYNRDKAYWWAMDNISSAHGNGIQFLLRRKQ